jgi:hypothetical protein
MNSQNSLIGIFFEKWADLNRHFTKEDIDIEKSIFFELEV